MPTPLNDSPNANCRRYGHDWDKDRPSVFSPAYRPPAIPITVTCQRCGATFTDTPDGRRVHTNPTPDTP